MKTIILFATDACHLCDEAKEIITDYLRDIQEDYGFSVTEIATSELLMVRYGIRIPVVRVAETGAELDWPFNKNGLDELLKAKNPNINDAKIK